MVMELRQLQYLVAVAEEGSFTRAAGRVHVAQPGISAQVRRLERELGQELLDRTGRAVRPTAAGEAVLPYARAALAAVEGARTAIDEIAGLVRGRVSVGTVIGCGAVGLPEVLAGFHRTHRGVELTLSEGNSDQLLAEVLSGELDMALVGLATPAGPGIDTQVVVDEELVLGVGPDDPWHSATGVAVAELRGRTLVSLPPGTGVRTALDAVCRTSGFTPRIGFESADLGVVAELAAGGLGAALLPASVASAVPGLRSVPLEPTPRSSLALSWRTGGPSSPAGRALVAHARRSLPALGG